MHFIAYFVWYSSSALQKFPDLTMIPAEEGVMGSITLVLGGTKSGKTTFAQQLAAETAGNSSSVLYIATARAFDEGMEARIRKHRASRPAGWRTLEEPLCVSSALPEAAFGMQAVLLDCLTLLSSNIILHLGDEPDREEAQNRVLQEIEGIIQGASRMDAPLVVISNQVETGLVAPTRLGGIFQDIAGLSHQLVARHAEAVYLLTAGIPQRLK